MKPFFKQIPLDWRREVNDGCLMAWRSPVWNVLASKHPDGYVVSFSRRDLQPPSEEEIQRFRALLMPGVTWGIPEGADRVYSDAVRNARVASGAHVTPNVKFVGRVHS